MGSIELISSNTAKVVDSQQEGEEEEKQQSPPLFVSTMAPTGNNPGRYHDDDDEYDYNDDIDHGIDCRNPPHDVRQKRNDVVWKRMRYLTGIAANGGFLFGYDTGVVSGAMLPMKRAFGLTAKQEEVVVSSTVLAAFVSSLCLAAPLNDAYGRRFAILLAAAVFGIGSVVLMCAMSYPTLVVGRIILGVGIGIASLTTPVYIAEVALPRMRGQLVTINTLMITFGQFFAGMVDGVFDTWLPETGWRYMLGLAGVPSLVMFVGFLNLPESPRWLVGKGRVREAQEVLMELRETKGEADIELSEIVKAVPSQSSHPSSRRSGALKQHRMSDETTSLASSSSSSSSYGADASLEFHDEPGHDGENGGLHRKAPSKLLPNPSARYDSTGNQNSLRRIYTMLCHAPTRRALILGCGIMAVQQCSGINTVMYYAASIYEMSGFEETTAVWLSGFTALAQVAGIAVSIVLVDRMGRRTLVLTSLGCVTFSLAGLAASFYLSRIYSGPVAYAVTACATQPATIWDGVTTYCYDCASIPGCGYCNGACIVGNDTGPADATEAQEFCEFVDSEDWEYSTCSGGNGDSSVANPYGLLSVVFMVLYLLCFGIGMGGMPWTINSEIYPLQYRSLAVSLSTSTNWIGNLVVSATFLSISSPGALTAYGAFALYGLVAFSGWAWLYFQLPETKGLSLEEIEDLFRRPGDAILVDGDDPDEEDAMELNDGRNG